MNGDSKYILSFKPTGVYGGHDGSAAIFKGNELKFAIEEERLTRKKHAIDEFPVHAIQACLDAEKINLFEVDQILIPYHPDRMKNHPWTDLRGIFAQLLSKESIPKKVDGFVGEIQNKLEIRYYPSEQIKQHLKSLSSEIPPIEFREHHKCHAASAYHPTDFSHAVIITMDGSGEDDSTVVWHAKDNNLKRIRTYYKPNSLGYFFGAITQYLGYQRLNGEGKVMGLAPYGEVNAEIKSKFESVMTFGLNYDVTILNSVKKADWPKFFEDLLDYPQNDKQSFDQFHKDVARTAQYLLEETVVEIVEEYTNKLKTSNVGLAGGVALNCKMNKEVMELDCVDDLFIQPVSNDAGLSLGAGYLEYDPSEIKPMTDVYLGSNFTNQEVNNFLRNKKLTFERKSNIEPFVAKKLAEGDLVGWMQGKQEIGPRALGNRSILADPRTVESRDRVNKYVKHREEWRPFSPSMLESAAERYLENSESSPYMIKTFDTKSKKRDDIKAVIHPSDNTTRPQTVRKDQNPRYYNLIREFEKITDVPVLLNTSFNDHGEPIVTTPRQAVRDFYSMGLDILVVEDYILKKES